MFSIFESVREFNVTDMTEYSAVNKYLNGDLVTSVLTDTYSGGFFFHFTRQGGSCAFRLVDEFVRDVF